MSRAWQAERAMDREVEALERDLTNGVISNAEYRESLRALQRDLQAAFEEDMQDAQEAVRNDWGW